MKRLNEMELLKILGSPDLEKKLQEELKKSLRKIREQNESMEELETEMIVASSLKGREIKEVSSGSAQAGYSDLQSVLEKSQKMQREYMLSLKEQVCTLTEQIETIQRIWIAFGTLDSESRYILSGLYIENYKWAYMEAALKINHRIFVKKRNQGIQLLSERYHGTYTLRELGRMKNRDIFELPVKVKEKEMDGQMSITEFLQPASSGQNKKHTADYL